MDGSPEIRDRRAVAAARSVVFLYKEFERACRGVGVSVPQYRLLVFLRAGPRRAGELAASAAIKRPTLTALVDGLVREGRIRRVPVEADRRGIRLELTELGEQALQATDAALAGLVEELARGGDTDAILDGLHALAAVMDREAERRIPGPPEGGESGTAKAAAGARVR